MAEYVRRKRPPATHPYWARLHDRANPPGVVWRTLVPAGLGILIGLYAGLNDPLPWSKALGTAATVALGGAVVVFTTSLPILLLDPNRQLTGRDRWPGALLAAGVVAVFLFGAKFVALSALLLWYSVCSGLGPWIGLVTGLAIGGVPGAVWASVARCRWRKRQEQWPRWERMRAPRGPRSLTPVPAPAEPTPAAESEPIQREGQRVAE